jgi:hypothetical protein
MRLGAADFAKAMDVQKKSSEKLAGLCGGIRHTDKTVGVAAEASRGRRENGGMTDG